MLLVYGQTCLKIQGQITCRQKYDASHIQPDPTHDRTFLVTEKLL